MNRLIVVFLLVLALPAAAQTRGYTCPIDGTRINQPGGDGQPSPRMYSDLEVPTEAYANRIVACPSCGYAQWAPDFERMPDGAVATYVQQTLKKDARRAVEPQVAWRNFMDLQRFRRMPIREQITALLYYTYVLKRARPPGGQEYELEMQIKAVRTTALDLLFKSLKDDPPRTERARLEWMYLAGELTRLTGEAKRAWPLLNDVCELREEAGRTVGLLACEMADRARRGQTHEDYAGGVVDVMTAKKVEKTAQAATPAPAQPDKPEAPKPNEKLPPMQRQPPPRDAPAGDAPPPPPPIPQ